MCWLFGTKPVMRTLIHQQLFELHPAVPFGTFALWVSTADTGGGGLVTTTLSEDVDVALHAAPTALLIACTATEYVPGPRVSFTDVCVVVVQLPPLT